MTATSTVRAMRVLLTAGLRADPFGTVLGVAIDLLRGATSVLQDSLLLKLLVDAAVARDPGAVVLVALGMGAFTAIPWLAGGLAGRRMLTVEERVAFDLEQQLARSTWSAAGIEHLERPEHLDRLELLRSRQGGLGSALGWLLVGAGIAVQAATVAVLLVTVHPALLFLFAVGVLTLGAEVAGQRRLGRAEDTTGPDERRARHLEGLAMVAGPAAELRLYGLEAEILRRHREARWRAHGVLARARRAGAAYGAAAGAVFGAGTAAAVWFVVDRALRGEATAGDVVMVLGLAGSTRTTVSGIARTLSLILEGLRTARRFVVFLQDVEEARPGPARAHVPERLESGITLTDVSFRYPGTDRIVLEDITLTLPSGSVVALVGENGAGKTTIVKLLLRMYEPTRGSVRVDGVDLRDIDPHAWRSRCAGAFQDFWRPELRLREAVGIGDPPRIADESAASRALARAGGERLLTTMPARLESQLGARWDGGVELSTGQWQTVALGRGLMRHDALLVVMDEPTAALDAASEHALFDRMAEAARASRGRGSVTLLVSHRFSTVRTADLIYVLRQGRVAESGSHDELMAMGGLYAELYSLQARAYG